MKLYFVRHGQTDFNVQHRLQGVKIDEPMNNKGVSEVNQLLPSLPNDFEVIYSSSLKRVKSSADIISKYSSKPIIISDEIRERDFGSLAGKTWDDIPEGRKLQVIDRELKYDYRKFGGENFEQVMARIIKFIDEIKKTNYKTILAVSSIGIIRLAYKLLQDKIIVEIKNVSVHTFEI